MRVWMVIGVGQACVFGWLLAWGRRACTEGYVLCYLGVLVLFIFWVCWPSLFGCAGLVYFFGCAGLSWVCWPYLFIWVYWPYLGVLALVGCAGLNFYLVVLALFGCAGLERQMLVRGVQTEGLDSGGR